MGFHQYLAPADGTICGGYFPIMLLGDKSATAFLGEEV